MIIYFIKSTFLCLVFFLIYKGMLEKKKSSKFKRFYLLVAMSIGLSFPLFKVQFLVEQNIITDTKQIIVEEISHQEFIHEYIPGIALPETNQKPVLLVIYVLISGVFAFRFLRNIDKILVLKKKGTMIETPFGFLVLNDTVKSPFSFYDRIYLNKSQWVNGKINPEILHHEQAHIQQKHTLDILFIELLKVFLWFQPFLYVFKRLMQENHEYLADEYSLSKTQDVKHYQQLILNFYNQPSKELQLSSSFYFSNLKKRFIMMKNTKKGRVWETVFYSSAVLVTYFAFVGIEAQAAEIKHVETKALEVIENAVKQPESVLNEVVSAVSEETIPKEILPANDTEIPVLKHTKGQRTSGYFHNSENKQTYYYVISPEQEVTIYNRYGVLQDTKNFKFKLEEKSEQDWIKEEYERKQALEQDVQSQNSDGIPVLHYVKGQQHSGLFTDPVNEGTYYYIVSADREVSIYTRYGVKQAIDNFTYKLEEKIVDDSEEKINEEYEKRKELEREVQKRSGLGEIDKKAEPKGGITAFYKTFQNEFRKRYYPEKETELTLRFVVEKDGTLSDLVVSSQSKSQDISSGRMTFADDNTKETMSEVLRVMQKMPNWNPAELKGDPVRSNYVMNISSFL